MDKGQEDEHKRTRIDRQRDRHVRKKGHDHFKGEIK